LSARWSERLHARAEDESPPHQPSQILQLFGQHVPRLQVRHQEDVGLAGDCEAILLGFRGRLADGIVESQRTVEDTAGDLAASAILQRAAASMVEGIFGLMVSTADRIATFGSATPITCARSMTFCAMCILSCSVGAMLIAAS